MYVLIGDFTSLNSIHKRCTIPHLVSPLEFSFLRIFCASQLPRATRTLPAYTDWSRLTVGLCRDGIVPHDSVYARGPTSSYCLRFQRGLSGPPSTIRMDSSADLIPGVRTHYPETGTELNRSRLSLPSIGCGTPIPRASVYWRGLSSPTCVRTTVTCGTSGSRSKCANTLSLPLLASPTLGEEGGSALPLAEILVCPLVISKNISWRNYL